MTGAQFNCFVQFYLVPACKVSQEMIYLLAPGIYGTDLMLDIFLFKGLNKYYVTCLFI